MSNYIPKDIAKQYMTQWQNLLAEAEDISSLFTKGNTYLYGFSIHYGDFVHLVSKVGIEKIHVYFGYDPKAVGFKFKLLLWGTANEQQITEYYCCEESKAITTFLPSGVGIDNAITNSIPKSLAETWIVAWQQLTTIPTSIFKTVYGNLRGYNFLVQDFFNVLNGIKADEVGVYLANRQYGEGVNEANVGLLLVAKQFTTRGEGDNYGSFMDYGIPCPPTCNPPPPTA